MKSSLAYLVDNNYVNIEKLLIDSFLRLRIDETDLIILLLLFDFKQSGNDFLSISELSRKTTLNPQEVANKVDLLVTKGFISLEFFINDSNEEEERFSLLPTVNKILDLLNEDENKESKNQNEENLSKVVIMLEDDFRRPLSSKELQIVRSWNYSFDFIKEALLQALKQKKLGIEYIDKILENRKLSIERDTSFFNDFMKDE
ncbi:DnaD domain protein [Mycoplasmatota bacterium WC44]